MKLIRLAAAAASICAVSPAFSALVTFGFEDQTSFASLNYPGQPNGIRANGALLALANDGLGNGPLGEYFANNGSATVMFATDPLVGELAAFTMQPVIGGFADSVSFSYSATGATTVYARDAGGAVLGLINLAANVSPLSSYYDAWNTASFSFTGLAASIDFGDSVGKAAFDDVQVNAVPLPAAALLFPIGLAALGAVRRKRQQA
jgi:hypothetical protein